MLAYIQNILHPCYKFCSWFRVAPFLLLPRLKFVFFSVSITAVSDILSTIPRRTSSSAISCNVHRSRPSGASEQAMAMICVLPVHLLFYADWPALSAPVLLPRRQLQIVLLSGRSCGVWHDMFPLFWRMSTPDFLVSHPVSTVSAHA